MAEQGASIAAHLPRGRAVDDKLIDRLEQPNIPLLFREHGFAKKVKRPWQ